MNDDKKILQTRQRLKGSLTKVYHGKGRKEMEFPSAAFDRWKTTPPEEEEPIMVDWNGNDVFEGDLIYLIGSDVVLKEDIENYIETEFGPATEA